MALDTPTTTTLDPEAGGDDVPSTPADEEPTPEPDGAAPTPVRPTRRRPPLSPGARFGLVVLAAVAVGFVLRLAIGLTDDAPTTDETAYLHGGLSIAEGEGFKRNGNPELHFPPLVPFLLGMSTKVLDDPHHSTIVLTCLSSTALIVPLALLGRRAAGPVAGMATAWVAALAPGLSTTLVNRGAGSEAEYTLLVVCALWLLAAAADQREWRRFALVAGSGLCVGLAYLTRPEGLFLAVPLGIGLILLAVKEAGAGLVPRLRSVVPLGAVFVLPMMICIVPYAMYLHDHTGKWQLSAKTQDASIEAWDAVANNNRHRRDQILFALDESGLRFTAGRTSLPKLAQDDPGGYVAILGTNVTRFFQEITVPEGDMFLGWLLLPLPLWGFAGYGAWRFRRSRTVKLLLAVSTLPVLTTLVFFVQARYLVLLSALATVVVGAAISVLSPRWRAWVMVGAVVMLASSSIQAFQGGSRWFHPYDQTDQRLAGDWIAANTEPSDRIMSRSMVVEFYAERDTMVIPYADFDQIMTYGQHYCANYLVVDRYTISRLRPQLRFLHEQDSAPGLQLVHQVSAEGRTTRVFELDIPDDAVCGDIGSSLGFVGDGPPAAEG